VRACSRRSRSARADTDEPLLLVGSASSRGYLQLRILLVHPTGDGGHRIHHQPPTRWRSRSSPRRGLEEIPTDLTSGPKATRVFAWSTARRGGKEAIQMMPRVPSARQASTASSRYPEQRDFSWPVTCAGNSRRSRRGYWFVDRRAKLVLKEDRRAVESWCAVGSQGNSI